MKRIGTKSSIIIIYGKFILGLRNFWSNGGLALQGAALKSRSSEDFDKFCMIIMEKLLNIKLTLYQIFPFFAS